MPRPILVLMLASLLAPAPMVAEAAPPEQSYAADASYAAEPSHAPEPSYAAEPSDAADLQAAPPIEWRKPILYSLSGMGVGIVALVGSRQSDEDPSFGNFESAFSSGPRRDDDSALYNFVLHPLWGSETYLRAREAHMGMLGSFAFSLGASVTWEYLIESWTEHPSTQDLVFTTGIGWMLGELRYRWKRRHPEDAAWVDPIHTSLERFGLGVTGTARKQPKLHLSYRF